MDLIDTTGSGDVDTSVVRTTTVTEGRLVCGHTGRTLNIPDDWVNPSGRWHVGVKAAFDLFPDVVKSRLQVGHHVMCNSSQLTCTAKWLCEVAKYLIALYVIYFKTLE